MRQARNVAASMGVQIVLCWPAGRRISGLLCDQKFSPQVAHDTSDMTLESSGIHQNYLAQIALLAIICVVLRETWQTHSGSTRRGLIYRIHG